MTVPEKGCRFSFEIAIITVERCLYAIDGRKCSAIVNTVLFKQWMAGTTFVKERETQCSKKAYLQLFLALNTIS